MALLKLTLQLKAFGNIYTMNPYISTEQIAVEVLSNRLDSLLMQGYVVTDASVVPDYLRSMQYYACGGGNGNET